MAVAVAPCAAAWAASGAFAPSSYLGDLDPDMVWELLIGSVVVASFLGAIGLWILSALRKARARAIAAQRLRLARRSTISTRAW